MFRSNNKIYITNTFLLKMCPNSDIDIKKSTNEIKTINTNNKIKKRKIKTDIENNIIDLDLGNIYNSKNDNNDINDKPIMDIKKVNEILNKENKERKSYKNEMTITY